MEAVSELAYASHLENLGKLARKTNFGGAPETKQTIDGKVTVEATPIKVQTEMGDMRSAPCDILAKHEGWDLFRP